eukprot:g4520.t1
MLKCLTDAMTEEQRAELEKSKAKATSRGEEDIPRRRFGDDDDTDSDGSRLSQSDVEDNNESGAEGMLLDDENDFVSELEGKIEVRVESVKGSSPAPRRCNSEQMARRRRSMTRSEGGDADVVGRSSMKSPVGDKPRFRLLGHLPELGNSTTSSNHDRDNEDEDVTKNSKAKKKRKTPTPTTKKSRRLNAPRKRAKNVPENVPDAYICAISGTFMKKPVQSPYGHTFERKYIRAWIKKYGRKCPFTGMPLGRSDLVPDKNLQREMEEFRKTSIGDEGFGAGGSKLVDEGLAGHAVQGTITRYEIEEYDSVCDKDAAVVFGKARFTVLSDRVVRMEYDDDETFEDRPSLAVVNRKLEVPAFHVNKTDSAITISTKYLRLEYAGGPFNESLRVDAVGNGAFSGWRYSQNSSNDEKNLRGTFRTLDGTANVTLDCNTNGKLSVHCVFGLASRSGWALLNDTASPMLDSDDWWTDDSGKMHRNADDVDVYLFAHGVDYIGALGDYMKIGGKQPVIPRQNFGIWFTRWYDLNARDVRKTIDDFESRNTPLDIFILDMNWHKKNDWSGYSWDRNLFPYPSDTLGYLHKRGLRVGANLHDATGIGNWEDRFQDVCKSLGVDPASVQKSIPFDLTNKSYVYALEDIVLKAVEDDGMDFWWIDWQQGETAGNTGQSGRPDVPMNPTIFTDKMRVTDPIRRCRIQDEDKTHADCAGANTKRGVVFARFGGYGNHRYQHGFSGDVAELTWANLAYQSYFSATASNVGWGFWSHDIEGPGNDHEMYTRWIQMGAYSGITRMHDRGMSAGGCMGWPTSTEGCPTVEPYNVPRYYFEANRGALRSRAELLPYVYTAAREAHDSGVGLTRPMYYYYGHTDDAYPKDMNNNLGQDPSTRQYFFGPDILVAPVTGPSTCSVNFNSDTPLEQPCSLTNQTTWLPPGTWFEERAGKVRDGGSEGVYFTKGYMLSEVPVFVRGGAVVARQPLVPGSLIGRASEQYASLEFTIYPGNQSSGSTRVYEDDGETYAYLQGPDGYAWTTLNYTRSVVGEKVLYTVTLVSSASRHSSFPATRRYSIRFPNLMPPSSVTVGGVGQLNYTRWGGPKSWSYDGDGVAVVVDLGVLSTTETIAVNVLTTAPLAGLNGLRGYIEKSVWSKRNTDETRSSMGAHTIDPKGAPLIVAASVSDGLAYEAGTSVDDFAATVKSVPGLVDAAIHELESAGAFGDDPAAERLAYSIELLKSAGV